MLGVPGQYESVALMLSHKMDFNCCANRDGFRRSSHICAVGSVMGSMDKYYIGNFIGEFSKQND